MRSRSPRDHSRPSRTRRRLAVGAGLTVAAVGAALLTAPAAQAADPVAINLVTVNDFHGRIEAAAPAGGIAALATAVDQIRAKNPNTVFAAAGDMIGASTFTSFIQQDKPTIDTLNAAGLDVSSVGNHEFDKGWADLRDRVQGLADWEYLASNVFLKGTDTPALPEYWITTFDGVTVGFVGAVTNELPSLVSPAGIADLEVRDVTENVNRVADELSDGNPDNGEADVVVLLVHEGASQPTVESATDPATPFGKIVNGVDDNVDAIVSGHTHLAYNFVIDDRPVISSGQYGEKFSDMAIEVDPDSKQILSMVNTTYSMYSGAGTTASPYVANYAPDAAIAGAVAESVAYAKVEGSKKVGDITADFNRALQPVPVTAQTPTGIGEARGAESTLGNFVADVQLWATQRQVPGTQIAFMNPGGLRQDIKYAGTSDTDPAGNVTFAEAAAVQPFANTLVTMSLTGDQIRQVLEQQWQPAGASRPFLKLGVSKDLTYTVDYTAAAGSRVQNLALAGAALDPSAAYTVVVNSFLAAGGDNFTVLAQGTSKADTGQIDLQGMVDWFAANKTATPDLAQRSIGVTLSAPGASGYTTGSTIDLTLSSLDFTTTETPAATVDVAIGGIAVGSAAIDRSLVAVTDEAGRATLSVTVPAGVSGTVPLTITTAAGTSFEVPIQVVEPVKSTTFGWPSKIIAKKGSAVAYTAIVLAGGVVPTGTVNILDGSKVIATATLTETDNGRVTVTLPSLARGLHKLSAQFVGSDTVKTSTSFWLPLIVW
ncbi:5'-nucleotidase C-terminal domain-containing protein [Microbacterium sp. P02]|uniref:5'-nucleotidase C-terminal domain-containing protein n=1 Tax=Microbacterium sp. P02 TaxID=3366260 RepID=UPI00366A98FE